MRELLLKKISKNETGCLENDNEYCYAIGQACNSIIKRIKINNGIKGPLINPIVSAKNPEDLHKKFMVLYKGNNHYLLDSIKLNNLIAMIIGYKAETVDTNIVMRGYLEQSIA